MATSSSNNGSLAASPVSTASAAAGIGVDPNHFPTHLYEMLEDIDSGRGAAAESVEGRTFASIVSWQPHGKCLLIHDEDLFSKYVLPKYFCRLKFTSFQRQLHFHGFKRLCKQGPDKGAYYHDLFVRGVPEVAAYIQRVKGTKENRGRKRKSQGQEPDFYKQSASFMPAVIAKAGSSLSVVPPELHSRSSTTNETPLSSHFEDTQDIARVEPTPIALMQCGQILTCGDVSQGMRPAEPSLKRHRPDSPECDPSHDEFKFNICLDLAALQQILHQGGENNRHGASADAHDLPDQSAFLMPQASSVAQVDACTACNDVNLWQTGELYSSTIDRGDGSATVDQQQMLLLPQISLRNYDLDLEPASHPLPQGQGQLQGQFQMEQQYDTVDDLQQHILRQIEEQQRHLCQQKQFILQRQQEQFQRRQMDSIFQECQGLYVMQQDQRLHQQPPLGTAECPRPFQLQGQPECAARICQQDDASSNSLNLKRAPLSSDSSWCTQAPTSSFPLSCSYPAEMFHQA